jgi:hypothetical protein
MNQDQTDEDGKTEKEVGPWNPESRRFYVVIDDRVFDAGDEKDEQDDTRQGVEKDVHDEAHFLGKLRIEDVESDVLVISLSEGGAQINGPYKGVNGQFEELRNRVIKNISEEYLKGYRHNKKEKDKGWKIDFEKIKNRPGHSSHRLFAPAKRIECLGKGCTSSKAFKVSP